jgi:cell division protein FtsL
MTEQNGSQAYDLSLFEPRKAKVTNISPNKKQVKANRKRARLQSVLNTVAVFMAAALVVCALGMLIVSQVQLTEMNKTVTELENELAILESQGKTLSHNLAAQTSNEQVEEYAKSHGMQQVESVQIDYFSIDNNDVAEVPAEELSWWESLWEDVAHFFGADA